MSLVCQIYRSPKREETYLYVDKQRGVEDVPDALLDQFGTPEPVMVLSLDAGRKLARADAAEVVASIEQDGYYLQMPPTPDELRRRERAGD